MRILIVSNTYPPADISGVGALVYELAHLYGDEGHFVRVITRVAPDDDPYAIAAQGPKILFPLAAAWRYLKIAKTARFDVVHVHESDGAIVSLVLRLARWLRRPSGKPRLVVTLHVTYVQERRAVRPVKANGKIVSRPTPSERIFAWVRAPLHALLGRLTARLADGVATASRKTAEEIEADYGVKPDAAIPNGVPRWLTDKAQTASDDVSTEPGGLRPVVLFVGRMRTRKAVAVLLEAFAQLRATAPEAELILAGDGEHRQALESQAESLGILEATRFLGAVPRGEIDRWYRKADVFCLPSTYEGFPVVILEAMAAGLPVVATSVSGIPEAVEHGVTGLLVEPEDAVGLAQALGRLASDAELCSRMGQSAKRSLNERFSIRTTGATYMDLFEKVLEADD
ncbi:MAG: glycosyltransferase family 4 protein [Acidobacteriota bacterium]